MKTKAFVTVMVLILSGSMILKGQPSAKSTDADLQSAIEHRLAKKGLLDKKNLEVSVNGMTVTLRGEVPTIAAKKRAEEQVKNMEEGCSVVNDLTVKFAGVPDSVLARTVQDRINRYVFYSIFDWVTVEADKGAITLKGWGHLPWTGKQIQALVEKIQNIQMVNNQIQFVRGDDDIRYHAARAIYGDPLFEYYAYSPVPPIHIIVDGPDIILEGEVVNEPDKSWAGILAEFNTDAIHVVNGLKVIKK
jgi:hypothetical protein